MHTSSGTTGLPLNPYSYLLRKTEEETCFECHGNPPLTGAKNIKSLLLKSSRHPAISKSGVHKNPETDGTNFTATPDKRHAECQDCHQPHRLQTGALVSPGNLITGTLLGAWGVEPTYGGVAWTAPTGYTRQVFTDTVSFKEYELCYKCHSSYAYGASPPVGYTDQTIEFNPNNPAYHAVRDASKAHSTTVVPATSYKGGFAYNSLMHCSDCHSGNNTGSEPEGPHGSSNAFLLRAPYGTTTGQSGTSGHLCFRCHEYNVYCATGTATGSATGFRQGTSNLHRDHGGWLGVDYTCQRCHPKITHGAQQGNLIVYAGQSVAGALATITSFTHSATHNYGQGACNTNNPGLCH